MDTAIQLCQDYNFCVTNEPNDYWAIGIGDLLFMLLTIQQQLVKTPVYLNLHMLFPSDNKIWIHNPLNALEFRLQLLQLLMKSNNIDQNTIKFTMQPLNRIRFFDCDHLHNYRLHFTPTINSFAKPYIVFHTKIRMYEGFDYASLMSALKVFGQEFRTTYTIILLGERNPPNVYETQVHNIHVCYNELLQLSNHNRVIDLTTTNYEMPDIKQYINDISIINQADINISFGGGGASCTAMIFGSALLNWGSIAAYECQKFNHSALAKNNSIIYDDHDTMIEYIWARYGYKTV